MEGVSCEREKVPIQHPSSVENGSNFGTIRTCPCCRHTHLCPVFSPWIMHFFLLPISSLSPVLSLSLPIFPSLSSSWWMIFCCLSLFPPTPASSCCVMHISVSLSAMPLNPPRLCQSMRKMLSVSLSFMLLCRRMWEKQSQRERETLIIRCPAHEWRQIQQR